MENLSIMLLIVFCILLGGGLVYLLTKKKDDDKLVDKLANQKPQVEKVYVQTPTYVETPVWGGWGPRGWGRPWARAWRRL